MILKIPTFNEMLTALQHRMKINLPITHATVGKHSATGRGPHNPAGSKLSRKVSRDSRFKHMWG